MVRRHYRLNGPEFEPTLGHSEGQRSLVCCSPWGVTEAYTAYQLNSNVFGYMLNTVNFTLGAGYFCFPTNILELCSGT